MADRNIKAEQKLKSAPKQDAFAQLVISDGDIYDFQYNPETLQKSRSANYVPAEVGATGKQRQQWVNSQGSVWTIPDLLLDTHCLGKSLSVAIEQLHTLFEPSTADAADTPDVTFVWGTESFGPAKVSSISIDESGWLDGEPAIARLSITLVETTANATTAAISTSINPSTTTNLTDRQREDARNQAGDWITSNLTKVTASVKDAFQSKRFNWLTQTNGLVTMQNPDGTTLANVGTWDGVTFTPSSEVSQ